MNLMAWHSALLNFRTPIVIPNTTPDTAQARQTDNKVIVVGSGPVGIRVAQDLSRRGLDVTLLSAETEVPYNRVRLTPLLGGDVQFAEITLLKDPAQDLGFEMQLGQEVTTIYPQGKTVTTQDGASWPYDTLVLATGSSAFVPDIKGADLERVYTFRTAQDASALIARSFSTRSVAIIGGGLLGLEAARGMQKRKCKVTVFEHETHLMPRQLDQGAARLLQGNIQSLGIDIKTGVAIREIRGDHRVSGLLLSNGEQLDCDTVIVCTGVRANTALARTADLSVGRGVRVDDHMRTSEPSIYAVGECAEHQGQVFGLVGPGFAQAEAAVAAITSDLGAFEGAAPTTRLKVIGADVFSVGNIEKLIEQPNVRSHIWQTETEYRRIFIERGKLVGALAVGEWAQTSRIQEAVQNGASVYPWMLFRFRKLGDFWADEELAPTDMPNSATLCNCTGVTVGQVRNAIMAGCDSVETVGNQTAAGTVCGSCRPLTEELLNADAGPTALPMWKAVLTLSILASIGALIPILLGAVPLPTSFDADSVRVWLWQDNIVKQWSGFILLGLTLAAMVIGLRKRFRFMDKLGSFDSWRLVHLGLGLVTLIGLFAHTGFSIGAGWNRALALCFIAVVLIGAVAGLATGGDHELRARNVGTSRKPPRYIPVWLHIVVMWPLPVLILLHVLASYAF